MTKLKDSDQASDHKFAYVKKLTSKMNFGRSDVNKIIAFLDRKAEGFDFIQKLSKSLNVSPGLILIFFIICFFFIFLSTSGGSIVCDLLGFLYPAYKSFKVLKLVGGDLSGHKPDEVQGQLTYWIKYWIVFSLGFVCNYIASMLLFWIPFFYLIKFLFIVLLLHHKLHGAELIYKFVVFPVLHKYEHLIDKAVENAESTISTITSKLSVDEPEEHTNNRSLH